jgi:hypothetical protein
VRDIFSFATRSPSFGFLRLTSSYARRKDRTPRRQSQTRHPMVMAFAARMKMATEGPMTGTKRGVAAITRIPTRKPTISRISLRWRIVVAGEYVTGENIFEGYLMSELISVLSFVWAWTDLD